MRDAYSVKYRSKVEGLRDSNDKLPSEEVMEAVSEIIPESRQKVLPNDKIDRSLDEP